MVQCRKINSRDCRSNRFAVSAVAATVTATAVVLVLVAAAITATAIDTVIYIDRDKNRLGPQTCLGEKQRLPRHPPVELLTLRE